MRRSRKYEEELAVRRRPDDAPVDQAVDEHGLAEEALRLQELIGNTNTTAAIARSPLQRDTAGTEVEPAKGGEEPPKGVYTMTVADVGTFDLVSWSWGSTDSGAGGGGAGPGKAKFTELIATKVTDKLSPELMQYASTGRHIATVELRTQQGAQAFGIKFKDVLISGFRQNDGDPPTETLTLDFAEMEWDLGEKGK